jgi:hypothetical protein
MQFATPIELFRVRVLEAIGRVKNTLVEFLLYEMRNVWTLDRSTYGGLVMHCAPGTHEAAISLLLRHDVPRTSVLDLGSGSGAMLARLRDVGFTQLHAVERNVNRFQLAGIDRLPLI